MTGLVIRSPWIDLILSGEKTWEIRGSPTKSRAGIALIKSTSGTVGRCYVIGCLGPLTLDDLRSNADKNAVFRHELVSPLPPHK